MREPSPAALHPRQPRKGHQKGHQRPTGISEVAPPLADEEEVAAEEEPTPPPEEPPPAAPTPEEVEEAAVEAEPEPTEGQREAGNQHKGYINAGDLDITIESAMGAEKNFQIYFFLRAEKESSWARFIDDLGRATAGVRLSIVRRLEPPFRA